MDRHKSNRLFFVLYGSTHALYILMIQILEVDGVMLNFKERRILSDIYLRSETGMITGILGRNGCGKSCLMQIIFGTLPAKSCSVRINGQFYAKGHTSGKIQYLPQFHFIPLGMRLGTMFRDFKVDFNILSQHFPLLLLSPSDYFDTLSGGTKRIVETLLILFTPGYFVMLDEPFTHIMPLYVEKIIELIHTAKERKGIIISDHLYQNVWNIADVVYLIQQGKSHIATDMHDLQRLGYIR
jgi:ABC-type multidrug transport system ATPase subunit